MAKNGGFALKGYFLLYGSDWLWLAAEGDKIFL